MGEWVDANGVHTYFDVVGDGGDPIVFLHGGIVSGSDYPALRDRLAQRRTVILPDRRGHGRTDEVDGPMSYDLMARDTIAFMEAIGLPRAHVVGHSDGAIIALLVAIARPDLVERLVPMSGNTRFDAIDPQALAELRNATDEQFAAFSEQYASGEYWPQRSVAFFGKMRRMFLTEPDIPASDLGRITAPALIMAADRDFVTLADLETQFRSIPNAQLAILPGVGHEFPVEVPDLTADLVERFLAPEG